MKINTSLVRECFELIKPILDQIINKFYENLFLDFPQTKTIISKYNLEKQKKVLLNSLITIFDNLENKTSLTQFIIELNLQLSKFPISNEYFDWAAQTFLKTLSQFLGRAWTNELSTEMGQVFHFILDTLKQGALTTMNSETPNAIMPHNHQENIINAVKVEADCLTDDFKKNIQNAVKTIVLKQIRIEVEKYLKEELIEISRMTPEELIAVAIHTKP